MKNFIPLTILSVFFLGLSTFFRKMSVDRIHPYQLQIIAGAIYAIEVPLWLWLIKRQGISGYDPIGVAWGIFCILTSVISAVLFSYLLKNSGSPSTIAMAIASNPLVVMALSHIFLNEQITTKKIIGCIVTIAGLALLA